jgi:hypothetical protein
VGEGGAGKTSLANKIINPAWQLIPDIKSESTKGVDILIYQFPYKDKTFHVNIWDFGGQEIYHQTHQFFVHKANNFLRRVEALCDFAANRFLHNGVAEVAHHFNMHIGLKQSGADIRHGFADIFLGDFSAAREPAKRSA